MLDILISERLLKSLQESEINNLYFDLVKFLLMAIFNLQEEEEEEEQELEQNPDTSKGAHNVDYCCPWIIRLTLDERMELSMKSSCPIIELPM